MIHVAKNDGPVCFVFAVGHDLVVVNFVVVIIVGEIVFHFLIKGVQTKTVKVLRAPPDSGVARGADDVLVELLLHLEVEKMLTVLKRHVVLLKMAILVRNVCSVNLRLQQL